MGLTALHYAARGNHLREVEKLLKDPEVSVNKQDISGRTALFVASKQGSVSVVKALLAKPDIDVSVGDNDGATPFFIACKNEHFEVAKELVGHNGWRLDVEDRRSVSSLVCLPKILKMWSSIATMHPRNFKTLLEHP